MNALAHAVTSAVPRSLQSLMVHDTTAWRFVPGQKAEMTGTVR
jgi:hypothetical protein